MGRYLVTGAAGFIGYHLCRRLLADGHEVTGYDGLTSYYDVALKRARVALLEAEPRFRLVTAMLEDRDALSRAAAEAAPEIIVHLAAQAGVRYSLEAPRAYIDSNLTGSWNLLEAVLPLRPRHVLMASTSSVYGAAPRVPFAEADSTDEPLSLYAATKKGMEAIAHSQAHLHRLPITAFRFFTVYGPWGRPDMALARFVEAIEAGRPIDVYGQGRMERDFTYVDDLVEAVIRLVDVVPDETGRVMLPDVIDTLSHEAPYRVVNIGGGAPVPLMEYIRTIEAAVGRPAVLNLMAMQPGDVPRTHADPSLLRALTGYLPDTPVADGVAAAVAWWRDYRRG